MDPCEALIRRIISRSGIVTSRTRRDLERELLAHLEDAAEEARGSGREQPDIPRVACERFGNPEEIAAEFARMNRIGRLGRYAAHAFALMMASMAVVTILILGIQLAIAVWSGTSVSNAFPRLRDEIAGFVSLTLGYTGLYLEERLFQRRQLIKALSLNCVLYVFLLVSVSSGLHSVVPGSVLAFVSGVAVRVFEKTDVSLSWILGTAASMLAFGLAAELFGFGGPHFHLGASALLRWTGISLACYLLTVLSRRDRQGSQG